MMNDEREKNFEKDSWVFLRFNYSLIFFPVLYFLMENREFYV